jgi:pyruvate dehydrogenase E2 component (dihydrolipoamide acetyltransferase)
MLMRLEISMPRVSEFSDDGTIAKWRVAVGDVVQKGEAIADVEVDMSTTEILAEADGKIVEIWVHAGQSVPVETVIAMQSVDADVVVEDEPAQEELSEGAVAKDVSDEQSVSESEEFPELGDESNPYVEPQAEEQGADKKDEAVVQYGHILASPAAVQLAEQYNVRLDTLTGTGSCGRIEREDVEAAMQTSSQFITAEDVDDLMSFDGDFASKMPSDEPEPVAGVEEQADMSEHVEEQESAQSDEYVTDKQEDVTAQTEDVFGGQVAENVELPEDPSDVQPEETPDESAEVADEVQAEDVEEGQAEAAVDEMPEEPVAGQADESPEEQSDEVAEEEVFDSMEEQPTLAGEEQAPEVGEEQTEDSESSIPDVIYMGDGPEQDVVDANEPEEAQPAAEPVSDEAEEQEALDASTEEVEDSTAVTEETELEIASQFEEDALQDDEESTQNSASVAAYDPTTEDLEAVAGFSAEPEAEAEPEALAIDESDTIDSDEMPDLESEVEEEVAEEPDPAKLDESTVAEVLEQTSTEAGKSVKVRRLVARKMEQSWQQAPHFFVTVAVDMTDVIRFRTDLGVTINDFILAATTRALQEHPWVNSHFINDEAVEQPEVNISLAVETEKGLYYPVVTDCGGKSVKDLGISAAEMVVKAHAGKLAEEEMEAGTFTISNMGMLGVESFSAIITPPQVAVLAVGTVRGEVVIDEHEEMTMAPMVRLTLSADHRALDGADAADFLGTMKSYLEAPITLVASQEDN